MFQAYKGWNKIIVAEGFKCYLPPLPDKSQIIGYNLPREEQYWQRQSLPDFYIERVSEEIYKQRIEKELVEAGRKAKITYCDPVLERYRRQEWFRRRYGIYFMNDGVPEFITGHHYFYLQWSKFDHRENDGYPFYYEFSRDNYYIRSWCEENPRSLGWMIIGPRATGKSNEEVSRIVNRTTMYHNQRAAMQSKHFNDDAKGVLIQAKTIPLFNNLPDFFKPEFSHGTNAQEELIFTRRSERGEGSRSVKFGPDLELQSRIFAAPPGEKALDTETLSDCFEDEIGKQNPKTVGDIYVRHETNVKTVFRNHRRIGYMPKTSTVEEMNEGGDECLKLWKDSDPDEVDGNGYTISKIHRHLISALKTDTSLEEYIDGKGRNWGAPCNKYGKVNPEIANIKIQADLDAVKHDLKKMSSRMRKSPRNETEAFIKDQSKSIFNIQLLSNRLEKIRHGMSKKPYVRGNLYWLKDKFGPVGFSPDEYAGRFNWAWFPDEFTGIKEPDKWKILNNFTKEWGYDRSGKSRQLIIPKNNHLFKIGTDPIRFTKTDDPRASKAAAHGFRLFDAVDLYKKDRDTWESANFIFEYRDRPEDPETYYEDMAMACIFLGCKALPERNVDTLNGYFKYNGLDRLLWYPGDEIGQDVEGLQVQQNSEEGGLASSSEVINYYTIRIMQYINKDINRMPFDNTIEDWMNFDPTKPSKYDLSVSSGFTLVHSEKKEEIEKPSELTVNDFFLQFDNSGVNATFAERHTKIPQG
jgi:hypothetical protein